MCIGCIITYMQPKRVLFPSRFGLKMGIADFCHFDFKVKKLDRDNRIFLNLKKGKAVLSKNSK